MDSKTIMLESAPKTLSGEHDFHFATLNRCSTHDKIRVLRIESKTLNGLIQCRLSHVGVKTEHVCLSYMWGPEEPKKEIRVNGRRFFVRLNLWYFLNLVRQRHEVRPLWIDAICINQSNLEERNRQVRMMGSIYKRANEVIAWLGEGDKGIEIALSMLHYMNGLGAVEEREADFRAHLAWEGNQASIHTDSFKKASTRFGNLSYWDRIWIKQEIMLNSNVCFWYGRSRVVFSKIGRLVHTYADRRAMCKEIFPFRQTESALTHRSLSHLISLFSRSESSEVRDRVYGLLSMADYGSHVKIDYNISIPELFLRTVDVATTVQHRHPRTLNADLYFLHELVINLGLSESELSESSLRSIKTIMRMDDLKFSVGTQVFAVVANSTFGARKWMEILSGVATGSNGDRLLRMENPKLPSDIDSLNKDIYRNMVAGDTHLLTGDVLLGIPGLGNFNVFFVGRLHYRPRNQRLGYPRLKIVALADYNPRQGNLDYFLSVPIYIRFFDRPDFLQSVPITLQSNPIPTHFTNAETKLSISEVARLVRLLKRRECDEMSDFWSWNDEELERMREVTFSEIRYL